MKDHWRKYILKREGTGIDDLFLSVDLVPDVALPFCWDASPLSPFPEPQEGQESTCQSRLDGGLLVVWARVDRIMGERLQTEPRDRAGRCYLCVQVRLPHLASLGLILTGKDSKLGCGCSSGAG